jgi:phenylacetaldehyde dehydrogenase
MDPSTQMGPLVSAEQLSRVTGYLGSGREAGATEYGLGAGIWTRDIGKAHAMAKKLRAGTVWINCYNVFDASLPFGGYKQSGWGREILNNYTELKSVVAQL